MLSCSQILTPNERTVVLPPLPQEPKINAGLKELHDLMQTVRKECLAASERQELNLARLLEQQEVFKERVLSCLAFEERQVQQVQETVTTLACNGEAKERASEAETRASSDGAPQEDKQYVPAHILDHPLQVEEKQPKKHAPRGLKGFVRSKYFDVFMGLLICLNVVMMFLELERAGYTHAVQLKLREETGFWDSSQSSFEGLEHFFNIAFFLELMLRFVGDGHASIRNIAVGFDAFIVLTSVVDYLFRFVIQSDEGANVNFLRMARLIKLVKLFRAFKAAAAFSELRILIKTLLTSMMALTWSVVLLSFIMLFSGLVMAQLVSGFISSEENDYELRKWVFEHYGSGARACYTLFEATLSGGWPNYARKLIEGVSSAYALFWIFYVLIVIFAVMRVVGALFLQKTLAMASADDEMQFLDKMKKKEAYINKLKDFLIKSDQDGSGTMNEDELEACLGRDDISAWLDVIGLESHEVMGLFHVLDEGSGEITHAELLGGMMKLSGGVRAIDSVLIQRDMKRILQSLENITGRAAVIETPKTRR